MIIRQVKRRGSIVPLLAITVVGVFALVALAVDIGLMALARSHSQNAADAAAMSSVRQLNGDASTNNNYAAADPTAKATASANFVLNAPITTSMVTTDVGYYAYDSTAQRFSANFSGTKPATESWSAVRVTVNTSQPMFFARVLGISSLPAGATATAVHRPRDVALVMDYSGSMQYSSEMAYPDSGTITGSLNPDPAYPKFGHYSASNIANSMYRTTDYIDSGGEVHGTNNFTIDTAGGPPSVKDFLFRDPNNGNALNNAFYRPTSPYNAMTWACPAPSDWDVQSDTTATYVGDKAPRYNKSLTTGSYARDVYNYLTNNEPTYAANHNKSTGTGPSGGQFDPVNPSSPQDTEGYGSTFKGYSTGPGYYGKTFYYWPPDPRFNPSASTASPATGASAVAKDTSGRWMGDWRKRFFYNGGGTTVLDGDNSRLWSTTTGQWNQASGTTYAVNYNAILAWITSGPQVLPPNLRAGRVLYYSAIPTTIPTSGLSQDQLFWKAYIDYVIGNGSATTQQQTGYGRQPNSDTSFGTTKITARSNIKGADNIQGNTDDPYMNYSDNPVRPRLQFWFGPMSMLCFLSSNNASGLTRNWMPGTCHEAQCWQLKAGVNSALTDVQKNHPNDWVGMIYFSDIPGYTTPRVALGKDYPTLKNALFFPFNTLANLSDPNYEVRPYDSNFNDTTPANVPNAQGGTCPEQGFMMAYNQFSSATGFNGRRGATKMLIFETDGVPNTQASGTYTKGAPAPYNSQYKSITIGAYIGNGDPTVISDTKKVATQICALDSASNPGYSTAKVPVRIHCLAFGELFETNASQKASALTFLLNLQQIGATSAGTDTSIESYKIIIGDYNTRIDNLRNALQRIFQSGVQVSLIN